MLISTFPFAVGIHFCKCITRLLRLPLPLLLTLVLGAFVIPLLLYMFKSQYNHGQKKENINNVAYFLYLSSKAVQSPSVG